LPIHFYRVKSHAGIIGNGYAEAHARKSITTYSDVANTSIKTAGSEGNPFYNIYWLAKECEEHQIIPNQPNTAQSPTSRLWYLSNYHDASQAHMHLLHKLGNADIKLPWILPDPYQKWHCKWSR
jgi:hypothetical protein